MDADNVDFVQVLFDDDVTVAEVARILGVSRPTVYEFVKKFGIEKQQFSTISDHELVDIILEIKENHPNDGYILMEGHLKARSPPLKVQRWRLRAAVNYVDVEGVKARKSKTIKRRQYSIPCPHYLWHLDGNHKLIKWRMVIHGAIDGFTRMITFMNLSTNNRATTVHEGFMVATEEFGWPIRIRTDFGGENELVWQEMLERNGPRAALVGASVHNQPIEQCWGLINDRCTLPFRHMFERLAKQGLLNTDNETDMMCLHWVFVPLIQENLTRLTKALNRRKISTEHNRTPYQLETQFIHIKDEYENVDIVQHEDVDVVYNDPASLERPLRHVHCASHESFPRDLQLEIRRLGTAKTILHGERLYKDVISVVSDYISKHI